LVEGFLVINPLVLFPIGVGLGKISPHPQFPLTDDFLCKGFSTMTILKDLGRSRIFVSL